MYNFSKNTQDQKYEYVVFKQKNWKHKTPK